MEAPILRDVAAIDRVLRTYQMFFMIAPCEWKRAADAPLQFPKEWGLGADSKG